MRDYAGLPKNQKICGKYAGLCGIMRDYALIMRCISYGKHGNGLSQNFEKRWHRMKKYLWVYICWAHHNVVHWMNHKAPPRTKMWGKLPGTSHVQTPWAKNASTSCYSSANKVNFANFCAFFSHRPEIWLSQVQFPLVIKHS